MDLILTLGPLDGVRNSRGNAFNAFRRLDLIVGPWYHFRNTYCAVSKFPTRVLGSQHVPTRSKIARFGGDVHLILTLGPLDGARNQRKIELNAFARFEPNRETVVRLPEHKLRRFHSSYTGFGIPTRPNTFQNREIWRG